MERPLVLCKISGGQPVPDHHIHTFVKHQIHHLPCILCRISIVAVDHQITVRVNVTEHAPHDISLSLSVFIPDDRTRSARDLICAVSGIVIIDVDICLRKRLMVLPYYFLNCLAFIVTWY